MCKEGKREHFFDNLRCLLIFAVVLGHCLEIFPRVPGGDFLYTVLYSFHMPAFLCLTGYFAKKGLSALLRQWVLPYLLFQTLYLLFLALMAGGKPELQYTIPYWILWYLLVGCFYCFLLPLYALPRGGWQYVALALSVILALAAGQFESVGYTLSLSRFIVFQPWFLLGYYLRRNGILGRTEGWSKKRRRLLVILFAVGAVASVGLLYIFHPSKALLYGATSYRTLGYGVLDRLGTMAIAFVWIGFLLLGLRPVLSRQIPLVGRIGRNTLPIFLLHGFVIQFLNYTKPGFLQSLWLPVPISCGLLLLFGQPWLTELLRGRLWKKKPPADP